LERSTEVCRLTAFLISYSVTPRCSTCLHPQDACIQHARPLLYSTCSPHTAPNTIQIAPTRPFSYYLILLLLFFTPYSHFQLSLRASVGLLLSSPLLAFSPLDRARLNFQALYWKPRTLALEHEWGLNCRCGFLLQQKL
jgi:hypothetical protein